VTGQSLAGRRVLVVEDEMLVLMITEDMLAEAGCESVTTAATVDQALALIDTRIFDAAMLDVNLNGTESYPLADALDARGVPFFFSTGYSSQGMKDGYRDRLVLKKPFQFEDLVEILTRLPFTARAIVAH
jgi:DNA-binding NtrC family response regulator